MLDDFIFPLSNKNKLLFYLTYYFNLFRNEINNVPKFIPKMEKEQTESERSLLQKVWDFFETEQMDPNCLNNVQHFYETNKTNVLCLVFWEMFVC